jgi:hypothetical protein
MAFALDIRRSSWGRRVLLWGSWACLPLCIGAVATLKFAPSLSHPYALGMLATGAPVIAIVLSGVYLALGIWLPVQWQLGLGALVANTSAYAILRVFWSGD